MPTPAPFLNDLYRQPELQNNCSGFIKGVFQGLGLAIFQLSDRQLASMRADDLIDNITSASTLWSLVGSGTEGASAAADLAGQGSLVVALLKARDHQPKIDREGRAHPYSSGHMSVVLPGPLGPHGYPFVVSGSTVADGKSDGSKEVRGVWRAVDAPHVQYYKFGTKFPILISK